MSDDPMVAAAEEYAEKVIARHRPYGGGKPGDLCRACHQRVNSRPLWPCDAVKLATLVLQRRRVDALLGWVSDRVTGRKDED